jgi:predicted DNA-binding protein (MmcQ/YjbR family)
MTADGFRRIALGMNGASESAHMGHPDFRVNGRIFATLGAPDDKWGMVALTPDQQADSLREHKAMKPAAGAWGVKGATLVRLADVDEEALGAALTMAFQNATASRPARRATRKGARPRR